MGILNAFFRKLDKLIQNLANKPIRNKLNFEGRSSAGMVPKPEQLLAERREKLESLSIPSQFFHLVKFAIERPTVQLERGALITSIDVDVGSHLVGQINRGKNDLNVHGYLSEYRVGQIEEYVIPLLIDLYNDLEIPVTFAVRGQITETESDLLTRLLDSHIKHDIAAHGYYHRTFSSISDLEAKKELQLLSIGLKKFRIYPKSFVFPKNEIGHLTLLEKYEYKCYRGWGGFRKDELSIRKQGHLYDIRPSFHIGTTYNPVFLKKIVDISCKNKLPFHIWYHPRDLYETRGRSTEKNIESVLLPIYRYAKKKEKYGILSFETMRSVVENP